MHAMGHRLGHDVDDGRAGRKRMAPALAHLDRIIAREQDHVCALDQRADDRVGLGREADAADHLRMVLGHEPLGLIGGEQRRAAPFDDARERAFGIVDQVEAGKNERPPCPREQGARLGQIRRQRRRGGAARNGPRGARASATAIGRSI